MDPQDSPRNDYTETRLRELFGDSPVQIPSPKVRLSIDATNSTPILAAMIAQVLINAGANVTTDDPRVWEVPSKSLKGLSIHIGQLTWVRQEEADRWGNT